MVELKKIKIAISGKANSGKNTVATLLGHYLQFKNTDLLETKIFAFADPIKEMIMKMLPMTNRQILWGPSGLRSNKIPNSNLTYRQLLLDLGKLGRGYNKEIWINAIIHEVNFFALAGAAIITDIRFKNELQAVKTEGFFLIRVVRPTSIETSVIDDVSETDLDDISDSVFHCVLINDGSVADLQDKIKKIVDANF